jgi:hypothetical protein
MDKNVFGYDPIIGCPFDDSAMAMVESWKGFTVGTVVEFRGQNKLGTMAQPLVQGEIIAIGENAKYLNGDPFTAFMIRTGNTVHFKTHREIWHVL